MMSSGFLTPSIFLLGFPRTKVTVSMAAQYDDNLKMCNHGSGHRGRPLNPWSDSCGPTSPAGIWSMWTCILWSLPYGVLCHRSGCGFHPWHWCIEGSQVPWSHPLSVDRGGMWVRSGCWSWSMGSFTHLPHLLTFLESYLHNVVNEWPWTWQTHRTDLLSRLLSLAKRSKFSCICSTV